MLSRGVFITGTDTGVGKTWVAALIASVLKKDSKIMYFKPVQSGSATDDDTTTVAKLARLSDSEYCRPAYSLAAPISPDRAAALEKKHIDPQNILNIFKGFKNKFVIVEGAGGIEVPLNDDWRISDLMQAMNLPVVIVSSTQLGTINHTLLTVEKAKTVGLNVLGVVLNGPEDPGLADVLRREGVEILFQIPWGKSPEAEFSNFADSVTTAVFTLREKAEGSLEGSALSKRDQEVLWHPYTQHEIEDDFPAVRSASGSVLRFEDGREAIDGISSWWVNLHGHGHAEVAAAIAAQATRLEHVMFAGFTHAPAVELAEKLTLAAQTVNPELQKVFYSDNGSTAVEVALKMAYQYHKQKGDDGRTKFLALTGSYHGDTFGAMAVSEREGYHKVFQPLMATVDFVAPDDFSRLENLRAEMKNYAACIVEPLLQGAGGMRIYSKNFLRSLAQMCREEGVLFIADEIFTGFGRTGTLLACEQAQIQPDMICLSKGITGGFLPLAATVTTNSVFEAFKAPDKSKAFLHGHSYTANPVACAAANASFNILQSEKCQKQIKQLSQWTRTALGDLKAIPGVKNVRALGTIGAFEVEDADGYMAGSFAKKFSQACLAKGVLIRPLGKTVYTVPPYSTTENQFQRIYTVIRETLVELQ